MSVIMTLGGELILLFFLRALIKRERNHTSLKICAVIMVFYIVGVLLRISR